VKPLLPESDESESEPEEVISLLKSPGPSHSAVTPVKPVRGSKVALDDKLEHDLAREKGYGPGWTRKKGEVYKNVSCYMVRRIRVPDSV
jgi:hypothetical protein